MLKSVNSKFTPAVHSPKLNHAKTHFLSHFGEKKRKNMARPGFEPTISRSEVDCANHYSNVSIVTCLKFRKSIYFKYIVMRQKVSLGMIEFW